MAVGVQAPSRLGRYELLARIATGGMGEIFLARLEGAAGFEKLYVVKRILPHLADDARFRAMLIAEARIASKLSHANICQVYELGETDGQLYIVMEYLEGVTMLPMLRRASKSAAPLELGLVAGVLQQAAEGLHYAHELKDRGGEPLDIVHRDVTPSNIFLTEVGVAKVLDFGIAKVKDASAHTQTGTVKGKYAYMAPEQLRGASIDRRADVFALGVVTFEMVALRRLFQRKTDYLTFRAVMEQPIPDVRRYRPDCPDAVAHQLARALDREQATRFESVRQFATAMTDALVASHQRPWTQGELGDYVRTNFADDIAKKSDQIAGAIHRTGTGGRTTMPLIAEEPEPEGDDFDLEFPPVETVSEIMDRPAERPPPPEDFRSSPPFSLEPSHSSARLKPSPHAAAPKRNLFWPILATVMVAITGFALVLVWKQMQQPPRQELVIKSEKVPDERSADVAPPPAPEGSAKPSVGSAKPPKVTPPAGGRSKYDLVIKAHIPAIQKCANAHGTPPANTRIVIIIATTGRAKSVALLPAELNGGELAGCIRDILSPLKYPTAASEVEVKVPLVQG